MSDSTGERERKSVKTAEREAPSAERRKVGETQNSRRAKIDGPIGESRENPDAAELREIYRNAAVGKESIKILRKMSEDRGFRNLLLKQYDAYAEIAGEMEAYAAENGVELSSPSAFAKGMMYLTAKMNALGDKSSSKLAEIMIQGINMGIVSLTKIVNKLSDEGRSNKFAEDMLNLVRGNLEDMKLFL